MTSGPAYPGLVTVAHGTRHASDEVAVELTRRAAQRLGTTGRASFVELREPLFADVIAASDVPTVAVPLLLSRGYHVAVDLPAAVLRARTEVTLAPALGPHRLLARAQVSRLVESGARRGTPVVMVAAGSQDPSASTDLEAASRLLGEAWGAPVRLAVLSGEGPRPAAIVRPGDAVSPYLLSPGYFATRAGQEARAAGATVVADVLGAHDLVVDLVVERARAAS
jgi:sirohydrochlorin ferrochelatase